MFFFAQTAEATSEVVTELASEAAEAATEFDPKSVFTLPTDNGRGLIYDYTAQIPKATLMVQVISAVLLLMAVIAIFVYVNRKHKLTLFSVIGGVALYIVFFHYLTQALSYIGYIPAVNELLQKNDATAIAFSTIYLSLFSAVLALGGRLLCMKLYDKVGNNASTALSVGYGLAGAMGVYIALDCFLGFVNCMYIDKNGIENAIWAASASYGSEVADALEKGTMALVQTKFETQVVGPLYEYISNGTSFYIYMILEYLSLIAYHFTMSIILLAAYTNKETKKWYLYAFGSYTVLVAVKYLRTHTAMPGILSVLVHVAMAAMTAYFAFRLYKFYYKDEQRDWEEENKKKNPPKKKMPKFDNLANL